MKTPVGGTSPARASRAVTIHRPVSIGEPIPTVG